MSSTPRPFLAVCLVLAFAAGSCGGSSSAPTAPAPVSIAPQPSTAGRFEVGFTGAGAGVNIAGILHRPEIASGIRPAIIVIHGWQPPGTNGAALVEPRAQRYAAEGYVALAVSMRGWPLSGGSDDCGLRQPDDVAEAVDYLGRQPGVDPDRIALVGFSQGGQVALLAAARGARVRAVVAYYPVTDVALWKRTTDNADIPGYVTTVCEPGGTAPRSPRSSAGSIGAPVLLVHGERDTRVPTEQSVLMQAALEANGRRATLFLVPGAQHGFTSAEEAEARPVVDEFLAMWLR